MYTSLYFILAATAAMAAPQAQKTKEFKVQFDVGNNTFFPAYIVEDKHTGTHLITGQRPSAFTGTNAYFQSKPSSSVSSDDNLALIFAPTSSTSYGAIVPNIGDSYGIADEIPASLNKAQYQWSVDKKTGQLSHKLYAAPNLFLSCTRLINDEENFVLAFGEESETGQLPSGCTATKVIKVAN